MSKFWFFDRKGRPTSNEKRICDKFNSFLDEGNVSKNQVEEYLEQYGKPMNENELEEMFGFLTGNDSNGVKYEYADDNDENYEKYDENNVEFEEINTEKKSSSDSVDFNPFEEPVVERNYTKGFQPKFQNEDDYSDSTSDNEENNFSDEDLKMPKENVDSEDNNIDEDIPEPEWANTGGISGDEDDEDYDDDDEDEDDDDNEKLGGDNLSDLTPAQKRKAAEKTAEALMNMYCQFVPLPFIKLSSFSERKIQKMKFENKIDLSMQLENNVTVKDYIDGVNEQAEEVFKVKDETKEEIKDPLIDVLLEQDLALTPTQRLMFAIGGHILSMSFATYQLHQNNKQALETFEKFQIQMNQQKEPVFPQVKTKSSKSKFGTQNNFSQVEKESVEELMRQMSNNSDENQNEDDDENEDEDDDIIDAENDPSVEISEDYGDNN